MSNKIKRREERKNYRQEGHKTWIKVILIIIVVIFIVGMIMIGF